MKVWLSAPANRLFLVLVVLWHCAGLAVALHTGAVYLEDSDDYLYAAQNLAERGVYYAADLRLPWNPDNVSKRPPGYPLFIAAVRLVGDSDYGILLAQIAVSIATLCGVSLLLQRRFGFAPSVNTWLLIAVALAPVQVFYANFLMAEILFQALLFWCFYACVVYYFDRKPAALLAAALLLSAAILTKPVVFLLWIPALVAACALAWRRRTWSLALYGALPLLAVVSWSLAVEAWTGHYHFSSMKKTNLLSYNAHALVSRVHGGEMADSVVQAVEERAATIDDYGRRMEFMESEATDWIMRYPVQYAMLHAQGAVNLLLDPGRYDLYRLFDVPMDRSQSLLLAFSGEGGYGAVIQKLGTMPVGILLALAVVALANVGFVVALVVFVVRGRCPVAVRVLLLSIVVYIVGVTGHVGAARYRTAILPLLLFAVPFAVDVWKHRRKNNT